MSNEKIKSILRTISLSKHKERINFILDYLNKNNISFNSLKYSHGINIEIKKYGKNSDKEVIFFAHYDVSKETIEGANDNTSSVAVLLKVAKYIANNECYCTTKIVFVDKEETLGALLNSKKNIEDLSKIIANVGSFNYLKNNCDKQNILGIFNLELSGIGDVLYISKTSGSVVCSKEMVNFLSEVSKKENLEFYVIPALNSDMISIATLGLRGVVYGAIPKLEVLEYNKNASLPQTWANIHSNKDNSFLIQESSLSMVYDFTISLIKNQENINKMF